MGSLGAFLNLTRRPSPGSLRSLLDVEIPVEQEVNILAQAAEERQKQDEAGPSFRPANPMQSILEQEKVGAFNALQNIPISPLASAVELASPGAYDAMTAPVEGANPEVPNMLAGLDQMSLGGLIDTPVAAGLLRTKAPSMKAPTVARLRGRPKDTPDRGVTLNVFHGTNKDFDQFDTYRAGDQATAVGDWPGAYFTPKRDTAEGIAKFSSRLKGGDPVVKEVQVHLKNPAEWGQFKTREEAEAAGYDGRVLRDMNGNITEVVAFHPEQIRKPGSLGDLAAAEPAAAPPFYSQARTVLEDPKTQGTQTGEAWIKFLTDPKRGVKSEEMQYTGLGDFLKAKGGQRVTRDEIQSHLDANEIEIKEVTKGARGINPQDIQRADEEMRRAGIVMRQNRTPENVEAFNAAVERYENLKLDYTGDKRETKFSKYTLPGAENYREVLLTLPGKKPPEKLGEVQIRPSVSPVDGRLMYEAWYGDKMLIRANSRAEAERVAEENLTTTPWGRSVAAGDFRSGHWDEPNVLAHIRLSDRTDADGKRTLLVEEIQSDWAQKGRKEGFKQETASQEAQDRATAADKAYVDFVDGIHRKYGELPWRDLWAKVTPEENAEKERLLGEKALAIDGISKAKSGIPTAPFVTDTGKWTALGLKRVLKMAADEGYDRIGIVPGVEQAKRYDLSKQISKVEYRPADADFPRGNLQAFDLNGHKVLDKGIDDPKELSDYVGKEVADKLVSPDSLVESGGGGKVHFLQGLDLAVGGEGMKGYYDKIVPDTLNKLAKEYGVKVNLEGGKVYTGKPKGLTAKPQTVPIHTLDVPEPMKKQIKAKGFPLYSKNSLGGLLGAQNA